MQIAKFNETAYLVMTQFMLIRLAAKMLKNIYGNQLKDY